MANQHPRSGDAPPRAPDHVASFRGRVRAACRANDAAALRALLERTDEPCAFRSDWPDMLAWLISKRFIRSVDVLRVFASLHAFSLDAPMGDRGPLRRMVRRFGAAPVSLAHLLHSVPCVGRDRLRSKLHAGPARRRWRKNCSRRARRCAAIRSGTTRSARRRRVVCCCSWQWHAHNPFGAAMCNFHFQF